MEEVFPDEEAREVRKLTSQAAHHPRMNDHILPMAWRQGGPTVEVLVSPIQPTLANRAVKALYEILPTTTPVRPDCLWFLHSLVD
jgi:hypothetical protein